MGIAASVREGVLTMSGGPNYESAAELKMFSMLGADCVGMSSIPGTKFTMISVQIRNSRVSVSECLVAHHCGMAVLAFCLVTNLCAIDPVLHTSAAPNHQAKIIFG